MEVGPAAIMADTIERELLRVMAKETRGPAAPQWEVVLEGTKGVPRNGGRE